MDAALKIEAASIDEFSTVKELVARYPQKFTEGQIRWAIRFRETNGLDQAIVKLGRVFYVHRPTFMYWFSRQLV